MHGYLFEEEGRSRFDFLLLLLLLLVFALRLTGPIVVVDVPLK